MLWWLAQNAVLAGLLALIVAVACRLGRFRPAVRHALWLVVLLKLVTPPVFTWPGVALTVEERPTQQAEAIPPEEPQNYQILADVPLDAIVSFVPPEEPPAETNPLPAPARPEPARANPAPVAWQWPDWLATLARRGALFGAVAMALLQIVRLVRFRRFVAGGRPASPRLVAEVNRFAARLRVRPPAIREVSGIASPLVCGLGRPLLVWPEGLSERLSPACQRAVIVHELAHLRRRDHWVAWLRTLAGCLCWWNPVFWYVTRRLGENAELACDAWVIGALPQARRAYAEALVAVAGRLSKTAALAPAVGMSGSRRDFERRLIMVMRESVPCKAPVLGLAAIGVLALAVLPGLSLSQQANKPAKITTSQPQQQPTNPAPVQADVPYVIDTVSTPNLVLFANQAAAAQGDERERKLQDLETKLQVLLKEVHALRGAKQGGQAAAKPKGPDKQAIVNWVQPQYAQNKVVYTDQPNANFFEYRLVDNNQAAVTLNRATYKLPKEKADALAAFLKHIKASVLETKVEDNGIVVTTTPDVQRTIGQLVNLMLGKAQQGAYWHVENVNHTNVEYAPANKTAPAKKP